MTTYYMGVKISRLCGFYVCMSSLHMTIEDAEKWIRENHSKFIKKTKREKA